MGSVRGPTRVFRSFLPGLLLGCSCILLILPDDVLATRTLGGEVRVRKSASSLTDEEKAQVRDAFLALKAEPEKGEVSKGGETIDYTNTYDKFVAWHVVYFGAGIHGAPNFLPWHRQYLLLLEDAMRTVDGDDDGFPDFPDVTLPYWNWTADDFPSDIDPADNEFLGGDGDDADTDIVDTGPFAYDAGDWDILVDGIGFTPEALHRAFGEGASDLPTADDVADALEVDSYDSFPWDGGSFLGTSFRNKLEGWGGIGPQLHNRVHVWVGGNMGSAGSPNDPVFFFNHANVDRIWCQWQELYPDVEHYESADPGDAFAPMAPLGAATPFDMLDMRALGYRYDDCEGPPVGLCCLGFESREDVTQSQCLLLEGAYRGDGMVSGDLGACCDRINGVCTQDMLPCECPDFDWHPGICPDLEIACTPPGADAHLVVLLDRTGSMLAPRGGSTRCADALQTAKDDVEAFFSLHESTRQAAVWIFSGDEPTDLTGGFVGHDEAVDALEKLGEEDCEGLTPLAETICAAMETFPGDLVAQDKIVAVSSDGGENNSDGDCAGPWSAEGVSCGGFDAGSWQELVCDAVGDNAVVMSRFWGAISAPAADPETGAKIAGGLVPDAVFFRALSQATGGRYFAIDDGDSLVPGPPVPCALGDGACVDSLTEAECIAAGGSPGWDFSACPPSPCDHDSDRDGVVDCVDGCPFDGQKIDPGYCGCGRPDYDSDHDGVADCADRCPGQPDPEPLHHSFETPPCGLAGASSVPATAANTFAGAPEPNPFTGATTIRYRVPEAGEVSVRVYDVRGQLVKTLVDRAPVFAAGEREVAWNGTDADGRGVSAGPYFYRVTLELATLGTRMWTGKVVLAR